MTMIYCDDCGAITDKNHGPEDGAIHCARCSGATEEAPACQELSLLDDPMPMESGGFQSSEKSMDELELFSGETIAQKRQQPLPTEDSTLKLVEDDVFGLDPQQEISDWDIEDFGPTADPSEEETHDSGEVESWQFDCLACTGRLAVEAVEERSKVNCPRCETWMIIDIDGEVILPGDEFGAPQPSCSSQDLEKLRQEVHRLADGIGIDPVTGIEEGHDSFESQMDLSYEVGDASEFSSAGETPAPGPVSPAALEAAEMVALEGDIITTTDFEIDDENGTDVPATVTTPADDLTAALSALAQGEDLVEVRFDTPTSAPVLTRATIGVYTMLFALPSFVAMSAWLAGPGSPAHQTLLRFGHQVQQNGNHVLDQIARFFAGI